MTLESLKKEIIELKKGYETLVEKMESGGVEDLAPEDAEYYGAYLGKIELCEYLLSKMK